MRKKKFITVAIDSPAAAGAGTQSKLIAKHYKLFYLDTGKIYRHIGLLRIKYKTKLTYKIIRKDILKLNTKLLTNKKLLADEVAISASIVARDKKVRDIVHKFQQKCAYDPPKKFNGSVLDGRDITSIQVKDAMFKFFITASLITRAKRRFEEYRKLKKNISLNEVLKSIRKRDKLDRTRKYGPLIKTKDSILINTTKLSKKACFKKIKAIMDRKLILNGNI